MKTRIAKGWFVLSVAALGFFYGFAVHAWEWFPKSQVELAWQQLYFGFIHEGSDAHAPTFEREGVRTPRPEQVQPGFTLLASAWKDSSGWNIGAKLVDKKGNVLHEWWPGQDLEEVSDATIRGGGSYLLADGGLLMNAGGRTIRMDACSDVLWTVEESNHHSIARASDGSFWIPGRSKGKHSTSERYPEGYPGFEGKKLRMDRILHISEQGELLKDINLVDVIFENDLERYIIQRLGGPRPTSNSIKDDVTHLNDVEPLSPAMAGEYPSFETGDLLVSVRELSLVFVLDPESLEVKWYASDPFLYQHDPDFIGNGWIGVFDNQFDLTSRGTMLGGSRIVFLRPRDDTVEVRFPTNQSEPFYTHVRGKWQQLENGNMLLVESNAARVVEVNPKGQTVWEWIQEPSREGKIPPVPKATRVNLTVDQVESWPCSSIDSPRTSENNRTE